MKVVEDPTTNEYMLLSQSGKPLKKNPAYGRHQLSRPMRIVGPIQI